MRDSPIVWLRVSCSCFGHGGGPFFLARSTITVASGFMCGVVRVSVSASCCSGMLYGGSMKTRV